MTTNNNNFILVDLVDRAKNNLNGVRAYLESAGIATNGVITLQHLNTLREMDSESFEEMINFLYPEKKANADGSGKWGASGWTGLIGTVLSGAGGILSQLNINGNTEAVTKAQSYQYMAAREDAQATSKRNMIIFIGIGVFILAIVGMYFFRKNA